ncbi:MAG TPA: hypothetical protein VIG47_07910 [Gemmatimonadaceae bacterium]
MASIYGRIVSYVMKASGVCIAVVFFAAAPLAASALPQAHQRRYASAPRTERPRGEMMLVADSIPAASIVYPGGATLRPARVHDFTDTLSLLITPRDSAERLYGTLVRRVFHVNTGSGTILRETQRYEFADGKVSIDTLDVNASTLAPVRYFSALGNAGIDVHIDGTRITGWRVDSLGARTKVDTMSTHPFFVSMMTESFIGAFPLDPGAVITVPTANPPVPTVTGTVLRSTAVDTINTSHGPVQCVIVLGPGNTTFWISHADGHLARLHWTLPNGTSVWKLPSRDVALRGALH